ncbi:succinate dehydrogenase / fumarate reductase cytochrome b subunit [Arcanobacterium pluranimalium]|uniref:succinate dehydrogenase cytochrome b subunit n=1 Tax=Arcanobacterium pluranimalium TaxID=108028 RepID=UPI00195A5619|nr:succinate dehydrogenase / fumarate reductase cytochrome b subunit [Arcanobacterium pluranimalium]
MANSTVINKSGRKTTVALKVLMAGTGLIFVLFLLFHMYGNLKMLLGADAFNHYAHWLQNDLLYPILPHKGGVWIMRVFLLLAIVGHAYSAIALWGRANKARGNAYKVSTGTKVRAGQTYTARTMRWGGIIIAIFIVFHLLQFTTLHLSVGAENYAAMEPYDRVVAGFSVPWLWAFYLVAMVAVALHVRHGVWSALATLGLSTRKRERAFKLTGDIVAFALIVGFMTPPTMILFGLL